MAISIRQVKAARALLAWSQEDLAAESGVSYPTIARLETGDGSLGGRADTADKIVAALEVAGIEFTNGGQPGVRLRKGHRASPATLTADAGERKEKHRAVRGRAGKAVDEALAGSPASDEEKAKRRRRLTKVPRGLKSK